MSRIICAGAASVTRRPNLASRMSQKRTVSPGLESRRKRAEDAVSRGIGACRARGSLSLQGCSYVFRGDGSTIGNFAGSYTLFYFEGKVRWEVFPQRDVVVVSAYLRWVSPHFGRKSGITACSAKGRYARVTPLGGAFSDVSGAGIRLSITTLGRLCATIRRFGWGNGESAPVTVARSPSWGGAMWVFGLKKNC